jgi:glycosyltransferase involved in cell wall biosynthesis
VIQAEIVAIFASADALLLHLRDEPLFAITIPSKAQFYLAMGKPIVAGIAGEGAELLRRSGAAVVVPPGDAAAMAEAISGLADLPSDRRVAMGASGLDFSRDILSFERAMDRTIGVLEGTNPDKRRD